MNDLHTGLVERIISLEWDMFSKVRNTGGPAQCQQDPDTFRIMRSSQCVIWPTELLESYMADLEAAAESGRNLMTEKYAFMMQYTFPGEFARIRDRLPSVGADILAMIDEIAAVNVAWHSEIARLYPCLAARTRPAGSDGDGSGRTSMETYLKCELMTWSRRTVSLYLEWTLEMKRQGINGARENLLCQMRQYGFESLEQVEEKLAARSRRQN